MLALYAGLGALALLLFTLGRVTLPRQLLLTDSFFLGLCFFYLGAWIETNNAPHGPTNLDVVELGTICLMAGAITTVFLGVILNRLPEIKAEPQPLQPWFVFATTAFLALSNLAFSYLVYTRLFGGSLAPLSDEGGLLVIRKQISTGERGYFFPGLVKQIRDMLGPALAFYLIAYSAPKKNRIALFTVLVTTVLAVFFGGHRMPVIVLAWVVTLGTMHRARLARGGAGIGPLRIAAYIAVSLVALTLVNGLLGRGSLEGTGVQVLGSSTYELFDRIVLTVPRTNIAAFDFVYDRQVPFGQLWLSDLMGLIPGTDRSISNEIHAYIGGSDSGNIALGFPVMTFVNTGMAGVMLAPVVTLFVLAILDRLCSRLNSPLVTSCRCVSLAWLPICYDPANFLLNGGLMLITILVWVTLLSARRPRLRGAG